MMEKETEYFGFLFYVHLALIVLAYLSPFLFNFKIMIFLVLLYYFQIIVFDGCILTKKQFREEAYVTFYYPYLVKLGFNPNKKFVYYLMRWWMPLIVLLLSFILKLLNYGPLLI